MSGEQFGRYAKLVVSKGSEGLDLSNMRFSFRTENNDLSQPNVAWVRIYNLSDKTIQSLQEFDEVSIDAGYESNHAEIFRGTVMQWQRGKETNVDSFFEIRAADNDIGYSFGFINQTFETGTTPQQEMKAYADAMGVIVDDSANEFMRETGGVLPSPRGKVAFGMARSYATDLADTLNARWSTSGGTLYLVPNTGYLPGEAVEINSATGMIGIPQATESGINVRVLLNPRIKIGERVRINEKDITRTGFKGLTYEDRVRNRFFPGYQTQTLVANVSHDGFYRVMVAEHSGDTRSNDWYTDLICLNIDSSAPPPSSVAPA